MNQWHGKNGPVSWRIGDTLYLSVVFSWDLQDAVAVSELWKSKGHRAVIGGPAAKLAGIQNGHVFYPVLPFHNPLATFTTRGCPNACPFCAVPQIEPYFEVYDHWDPRPVICDNNILAAGIGHFRKVVSSVKHFPHVDFNQGLDASLFTDEFAEALTELKSVKVRFSIDSLADCDTVANAVTIARRHGLKDIGIYVLIGFDDTPADGLLKLEFARSGLGIRPNPMRYQPLDCTVKDSYVAPGWTKDELRNMVRYYSRLRYLEHIPFKEYHYGQDEQERLI